MASLSFDLWICFIVDTHAFLFEVLRAFTKTGIAIAARIPIMAIKTGIIATATRHPISHGEPDFFSGISIVLPHDGQLIDAIIYLS